ncbi:hypothetical protein L3Q82_018463 [Scortum barcoo]|uniref:Uncharacterized protein n=1 Tax=Scortum barcoo TaxID=214431 RepID=A0ACB8VEG1_9TELE|nr:hypothetical protein L3Q82_018463 [Scortum barcoo]
MDSRILCSFYRCTIERILTGCITAWYSSCTDPQLPDEILRPLVRPYAGAVGPGFLLMQDNARPHVAGVCQQFLQDEGIDAMDWPARSPDLNPIEHIWDIMSRSIHQRHVAPQTVQELADALVQDPNATQLATGTLKLEQSLKKFGAEIRTGRLIQLSRLTEEARERDAGNEPTLVDGESSDQKFAGRKLRHMRHTKLFSVFGTSQGIMTGLSGADTRKQKCN